MADDIRKFLGLIVFGNIENLILAAQGVEAHVNPLGLAILSLIAVCCWLLIGTFGTKMAMKYARYINFIGGLAIFILGIQAILESIPGMLAFFHWLLVYMSYLKHKIYGILFKLFKSVPIKDNKVSFIIDSRESFKGNLDYIKKEFEKRGNFEFYFFYKDKLSFTSFKNLASSKYIFLNDNFFPLAFMNFKDENIIVQLWHAPGASKKFGGSVEIENREILSKISQNTNYLITTSDKIKEYYSEAFQMPKEKIKSLGLPRMDYYFENHDLNQLKSQFCKKHDIDNDKKIILYAPTFREEEKYNNVFDFLDLEKFNKSLGDEYVLALRLHPKINKFYSEAISAKGKYIDVSGYENEQELMLLSDILITDYSSIMIEFCALDKPTVFFTYDLDNYLAHERGFYYDFKETVPGPIVYTTEELIDVIENNKFDKSKILQFTSTQFDVIDGKSSKRIVDYLLK